MQEIFLVAFPTQAAPQVPLHDRPPARDPVPPQPAEQPPHVLHDVQVNAMPVGGKEKSY